MKRICLVLLILSISICANAQIYFKTYTGYSFSMNPQKIESTAILNGSSNVYINKYRNGEGLNLGLACGYSLSNSLAIEFVGNSQVFATQNISTPQYDYRQYQSFTFIGYFGKMRYSNSMLQLSPQIVYKIDYKKLNLYLKAGPNLMIVNNDVKLDHVSWTVDQGGWSPQNHIEAEYKMNGDFCIGLQTSCGVELSLSKNINFFVEFLAVNTTYKYKEAEVVRYDVDGVDYLEHVTVRTEPIENGLEMDFSHIGLNIGIKYVFNKKMKKRASTFIGELHRMPKC